MNIIAPMAEQEPSSLSSRLLLALCLAAPRGWGWAAAAAASPQSPPLAPPAAARQPAACQCTAARWSAWPAPGCLRQEDSSGRQVRAVVALVGIVGPRRSNRTDRVGGWSRPGPAGGLGVLGTGTGCVPGQGRAGERKPDRGLNATSGPGASACKAGSPHARLHACPAPAPASVAPHPPEGRASRLRRPPPGTAKMILAYTVDPTAGGGGGRGVGE